MNGITPCSQSICPIVDQNLGLLFKEIIACQGEKFNYKKQINPFQAVSQLILAFSYDWEFESKPMQYPSTKTGFDFKKFNFIPPPSNTSMVSIPNKLKILDSSFKKAI